MILLYNYWESQKCNELVIFLWHSIVGTISQKWSWKLWEQLLLCLCEQVRREILISKLFCSHDFVVQSTPRLFTRHVFGTSITVTLYSVSVLQRFMCNDSFWWTLELCNFTNSRLQVLSRIRGTHSLEPAFVVEMICFQLFTSRNLKGTLLSERREQWKDYRETRTKILARVINFNKSSLFCVGGLEADTRRKGLCFRRYN